MNNIQPEKIMESIRENFEALRQVNHDDLSDEERKEMREQMAELKEMALAIKKKIQEL